MSTRIFLTKATPYKPSSRFFRPLRSSFPHTSPTTLPSFFSAHTPTAPIPGTPRCFSVATPRRGPGAPSLYEAFQHHIVEAANPVARKITRAGGSKDTLKGAKDGKMGWYGLCGVGMTVAYYVYHDLKGGAQRVKERSHHLAHGHGR